MHFLDSVFEGSYISDVSYCIAKFSQKDYKYSHQANMHVQDSSLLSSIVVNSAEAHKLKKTPLKTVLYHLVSTYNCKKNS